MEVAEVKQIRSPMSYYGGKLERMLMSIELNV